MIFKQIPPTFPRPNRLPLIQTILPTAYPKMRQKWMDTLLETYATIPQHRSMLVAISGIDSSGKGYLSHQIRDQLLALGINTILLHGDDWLNLPPQRFNPHHPAEHFYHHAFRFSEMFSQLVLPLRQQRSLEIWVDITTEIATQYQQKLYQFSGVQIILLEAIYLLQNQFMPYYDLSLWIDCSFSTALKRAIQRNQEGLSPAATIHAYKTIYFPAQLIHFQRDDPKTLVQQIINNDPEFDFIQNRQKYPSLLEIEDFK